MKTGLILVDIQKDYFEGGCMELVGMKEASENARKILLFFREQQWPVFHVQHISVRKGATFFLPDSEGIEFHENVTPLPEEVVIQKHHPNSFLKTSLHDELVRSGVQDVVICGAMSHMCIDATTRAAADLKYPCTVIHDACATKNLDFGGKTFSAETVHGVIMAALQPLYARVLSRSEFFAWIKTL